MSAGLLTEGGVHTSRHVAVRISETFDCPIYDRPGRPP